MRTCFAAAKRNGKEKNGMRYDIKWIYQCLLMRIKAPTMYENLRRNKMLSLPTKETLHKYISSFDKSYGFKEVLFRALKKKILSMPRCARRGKFL